MRKQDLQKNLPASPGVYLFKKRSRKVPLYIGKATNLRDRARSYFTRDIADTRGPRITAMREDADRVEVIRTDTVLEALLLEAELIKKFKPPYNAREKDDKSYNHVVITEEDYPCVMLMRGKELAERDHTQFKYIVGPFPAGSDLKTALKLVRKIFPWRDHACTPLQGKPCFNRQIALCPGVCTGEIGKDEYQKRIAQVALFLKGRKNDVLKKLKKEMKKAAKKRDFERAAGARDRIWSIEHIQDVALMKRERDYTEHLRRIEAYDIAHLGGSEVVGAMAVAEGARLAKSEYRKFKMQGGRPIDDTGNLKEVLERRLAHEEWRYPDLVVVDGGVAQTRAAERVLSRLRLRIPVVGVVKGKDHKARLIRGPREIVQKERDIITLLNAEAHRFAITFHRRRLRKR